LLSYPLPWSVLLFLCFLDAILVRLVGLIMRSMILRLCHLTCILPKRFLLMSRPKAKNSVLVVSTRSVDLSKRTTHLVQSKSYGLTTTAVHLNNRASLASSSLRKWFPDAEGGTCRAQLTDRQQKRALNPNPPGLVVSQKVGSGLGSEFVWIFVRFVKVEEVRHVVIFFSLPWPLLRVLLVQRNLVRNLVR
jgi:hypothetical protein